MRVTPADSALPSLPSLFSDQGMPHFIADAVTEITGPGTNAGDARIAYVRYRPAESCSVLWRLPVRQGPTQLFLVTLYADDRGAALVDSCGFRELAARARTCLGSGQAYRYLAPQRVLLQAFPLDHALPTLPRATSPEWLRAALSKQVGVPAERIRQLEATPVSYKPGIRCVLRYDVDLGDRSMELYGKVFRDHRGESMLAPLQELQRQLHTEAAPWDTPGALAYLAEAQMLLMAGLGRSSELSALIKQAAHDAKRVHTLRAHMRAAAAGLGSLQKRKIEGLTEVPPRSSLGWVEGKLSRLKEVKPELDRTIHGLLAQLQSASERLPAEAMVVSHGAFRYTQCLLSGAAADAPAKMAVVDLDKLCLSGASADAGEFLSRFDMAVLRDTELKSVIEQCEQAFVDGLHGAMHSGWRHWYRAFGDIKWALYSFLSLAPGWTRTSTGLLQMAQHWLDALAAEH